jgi:hypothetical protein
LYQCAHELFADDRWRTSAYFVEVDDFHSVYIGRVVASLC